MFRTTVTGMTIAALVSGVCWAGPFEARMLNKGADGERMVFEPAFVKAAPRDTIPYHVYHGRQAPSGPC
ncbi:hypothetical protein ACP2AV_01360 [Aliiroseovarius sp. PTFE2010]|uniref:hypothetical protein n=1 Tax=Aliiroseovarius sp. PTFE2010 TaxID=3417190 RepID=UPI003CF7B1A7